MATEAEIEAAAKAIAWLDPYGDPANVMDAAKAALEAAERASWQPMKAETPELERLAYERWEIANARIRELEVQIETLSIESATSRLAENRERERAEKAEAKLRGVVNAYLLGGSSTQSEG